MRIGLAEAAAWYDTRRDELGDECVEEILKVFDALAENPLLNCRRHPDKNIRWRYPERFPYRVIYEVLEAENTVRVCKTPSLPARRAQDETGAGRLSWFLSNRLRQ